MIFSLPKRKLFQVDNLPLENGPSTLSGLDCLRTSRQKFYW